MSGKGGSNSNSCGNPLKLFPKIEANLILEALMPKSLLAYRFSHIIKKLSHKMYKIPVPVNISQIIDS